MGNRGWPVYCWNYFNNGISDKQISQRNDSYYIPLHNGAITSCPKIFSTEIVRTTYTQQSKDVWTRNLVLD